MTSSATARGGTNDDTFVHINKKTGVATEFLNTGLDTSQNGLSFSNSGQLWNFDSSRIVDGVLTQTAYLLDPSDEKPISSIRLSPATNAAALGDFNPVNNLYYGLNFVKQQTFIEMVDVSTGIVTGLGQRIDNLHVIAFVVKK